jgi:acetyl-CoA carboxylase carboxyltransferase component
VFAWPGAQIGVMGAQQAVALLHRRTLAAEPERRDDLTAAYAEEHLGADGAAADGHIDEIVDPSVTRMRLADALNTLDGASTPAETTNLPL